MYLFIQYVCTCIIYIYISKNYIINELIIPVILINSFLVKRYYCSDEALINFNQCTSLDTSRKREV